MIRTDDTQPATAHTPEPWRYVNVSTPADAEIGLHVFAIESANVKWDNIATLIFNEADARRIVAVVNACKGISTEALEHGVVCELLEALKGCLFTLDKNADGYGPSKAQAIAAATAAIANATGRAA